MKILIFTLFIGLSLKSFSQATMATNAGATTRYLGWIDNVVALDFKTNNFLRMKLQGQYGPGLFTQYGIDGYSTFGNTNTTLNTTGYLLLGNNSALMSNTSQTIYGNKGAFSLLHLNGTANVQQNGYRPWMKTGITFTDNQDLSYFGLRQVGTGFDFTETVLNWSDNVGSSDDDMVFRFTGNTTGSTTIDQANLRSATDLDGLHIARFSANGRFGLGNTFGHTNAPGHPINFYVTPQSLLHMSYDRQNGAANQPYGFMQISYRDPSNPTLIGTGELATDGLRFGIDNQVITGNPQNYLNSYLRWQEASNFIIQTEDDNTPNIGANERLRVTSIGAMMLTQSPPLGYDGLTTTTNATRISISESGSLPLERPKSLLHLGYDYGGFFTVQGYRKWMDLGMLTSNNRDHVWIGLKPRDSIVTTVNATNDRLDAVVAWGTDRQAAVPTAVDNMRFIFTGHTLDANPDLAPSTSYNGLEMMRMYPATVYHHPIFDNSGAQIDSTQSYGRVGIGDFTVSGVNEEPTHKLDVVGNGRFRYLPDSVYMADSLVKKIVMVDEDGVLRWGNASGAFGAACSDAVNGKLDFDTKVDLNDHNLYFTRNDSIGANKVGIGYDCGTTLEAKLNVFSKNETWSGSFYVDGNSPVDTSVNSHQGGVKSIIDSTTTKNATAIYGYVAPNNTIAMDAQIGVKGKVDGRSAKEAIGVFGESSVLTPTSGALGGRFLSSGSAAGRAVQAQNFTVQTSGSNSGFGFGGDFNSSTTLGQTVNSNTGVNGSANGNATLNNGVRGLASGNGTTNIGVYGQAINGGINWAGYFDGNVYISGTFGPSDENLKENVETIGNADSLINLLNPVTFDFRTDDYPQLNLQTGNQMGLIAQQVETVFPNIVKENTSPAQYDSVGTLVYPSVDFKTVDYTKLIPVLISGHKEQAAEIQAKDSIIDSLQNQLTDLNDRLTQLENCLSGILPYLCQLSNSAIQANTPEAQEEVRKNLNVTLSNRSTIVLDQNVPNPFAEQTIINFSIPETVKKAQIHFYDANGRFMNSVEVTERGLGSLTVFGSDLSTGVYTYTLVADGQVVATKKMMKQ